MTHALHSNACARKAMRMMTRHSCRPTFSCWLRPNRFPAMTGWLVTAALGVLALGGPAPAHSRPVSPLDPSAQFSAESMAENAKNCMFLYQAPRVSATRGQRAHARHAACARRP